MRKKVSLAYSRGVGEKSSLCLRVSQDLNVGHVNYPLQTGRQDTIDPFYDISFAAGR